MPSILDSYRSSITSKLADQAKKLNEPVSKAGGLNLLSANPFKGLSGLGNRFTASIPSLNIPKFSIPEIPSLNIPVVSESLGSVWDGVTAPLTKTAESAQKFKAAVQVVGLLIVGIVVLKVVGK